MYEVVEHRSVDLKNNVQKAFLSVFPKVLYLLTE